jgi:hypothetical protein
MVDKHTEAMVVSDRLDDMLMRCENNDVADVLFHALAKRLGYLVQPVEMDEDDEIDS